MSHKPILTAGGFVLVLAGLALIVPGRPFAQEIQEAQIVKPKIFDETYQLINESDLNCSFFMHEEGKLLPDIRIIGAERMNEKSVFENEDSIYLDKGAADGLEIGQLFLSVGLRAKVGKIGTVMERHGRARIVRLDERMATAKVEKGCGRIMIGDFLLPFEEEAGETQGFSATRWIERQQRPIVASGDFISRPEPVGPDRHGRRFVRSRRLNISPGGPDLPRGYRQLSSSTSGRDSDLIKSQAAIVDTATNLVNVC
jgi:hypothetical protein